MRKIATVKNDPLIVKQVMIYECENGVYVFPFASLEDGSSIGDAWYQSLSEADSVCKDKYGIGKDNWKCIGDPLENCQHDWISPVRIKGRNIGLPEWRKLERLENGIWKEFVPNE